MSSEVVMRTTIKNCARCQGEHELAYRTFSKNRPLGYMYWDLCMITNEPILIKVKNIEKPDRMDHVN